MIFYSKHVRVFGKSRTCFWEKSYVFFKKVAVSYTHLTLPTN